MYDELNQRLKVLRKAAAGTALSVVLLFAFESNGQGMQGLVRTASPVPSSSLGNPFGLPDGSSTRIALFDGLTSLSRDAKLQPALATDWRAESPTTWVFNLRQNVVFHNGEPFTAEAVATTLNYLIAPDAVQNYVARYAATIESVEVINPFSVAIHTHEPDPILPNRLTNVLIVAPGAWTDMGVDRFTQEPVGTGPFSLNDWGPGGRDIELNAFDPSWRKGKNVRRVKITVLPDSTTRLQALLSDQIDIAVNLDPDSIPIIESAGFNVLVMPAPHLVTIALRNVGEVSEPVKNKRVRQALNYAINKRVMADDILYGHVRVASQAVTPEVFGYNPALAPYEYDPERARRLLDQAGYGDGLALTFGVTVGQTPADTLLYQLVQQDLAAVGVDVTLRLLPFPDLMRRIESGEWDNIDAYSTTLSSAWYGDAVQAIERMSCAYPSPFFCEPDLMDLIEESNREMDVEQREALLQDVLAQIHDLAPVLYLVDYSALTATAPRIGNYTARSNGVLFEEIELIE